jgi:hypothetical protein
MDMLSKYLANEDADLLKLDVEGSEELIITDLVENHKIKLIKKLIVEYHPATIGHAPSKLIEVLRQHKFSVDIKTDQPATSEILIYGERK